MIEWEESEKAKQNKISFTVQYAVANENMTFFPNITDFIRRISSVYVLVCRPKLNGIFATYLHKK